MEDEYQLFKRDKIKIMKLIVGLGNPGLVYADTRHNVGFKVINKVAKLTGIELKERRYQSRMGQGKISEHEVILANPMTYMNLSGKAVELLVRNFKVPPLDLLVVYDDVSLELGKIRIRKKGSAGGHNGIKSIIEKLACEEFPRIRIGIGTPLPEVSFRDYVLSPFSDEENEVIERGIEKAAQAVICAIEEGIDVAMNKYN
ncbi:MAG: aminoacyl-tRNA hydrolase [bacterium]|nr:aminoacyl-tRNA hydrolase [bacterium]